ncbi:MAG: hypothetical protein RL057_759, partial [Actinomycetota bacterium]
MAYPWAMTSPVHPSNEIKKRTEVIQDLKSEIEKVSKFNGG